MKAVQEMWEKQKQLIKKKGKVSNKDFTFLSFPFLATVEWQETGLRQDLLSEPVLWYDIIKPNCLHSMTVSYCCQPETIIVWDCQNGNRNGRRPWLCTEFVRYHKMNEVGYVTLNCHVSKAIPDWLGLLYISSKKYVTIRKKTVPKGPMKRCFFF